ncbi:hypothetical protein [Paenibacillus fonticola]|uniref:hypothetical protein n=1 Tax=Paenibacillus fonticola TaxID=379896 RepID=UPI0003671168|nr:hypothetical protein [Paenibacillus fonticola]
MTDEWMQLIIEFTKSDYLTKNLVCPDCRENDIEYVYVGDKETNIGYLTIWCNQCRNGVQICRVSIPEGVRRLDFDDLESIKMIPAIKLK